MWGKIKKVLNILYEVLAFGKSKGLFQREPGAMPPGYSANWIQDPSRFTLVADVTHDASAEKTRLAGLVQGVGPLTPLRRWGPWVGVVLLSAGPVLRFLGLGSLALGVESLGGLVAPGSVSTVELSAALVAFLGAGLKLWHELVAVVKAVATYLDTAAD